MFTKTNKKMWQMFWVGTVSCLMAFAFVMPCSGAPKGKVVIGITEHSSMSGGDPHTAAGAGGINIANLIHEGLVRMDVHNRYVPALAKSWEVSRDELSIKFTLNERAKFHNGEPVTAKDVKFSIERSMKPELKYTRGGAIKRVFDRIEVQDDHHLTVYFKSPYPAFFEWCQQHLGIVPKAYVEKVGDTEFAKRPIGAGPFKWIDYQQEIFINAEAVEDHYRKVPEVKTVQMRFVTEPATIMAMFKSGEADMIQVPISNIPEVKNDPRFRIEWAKFVCQRNLIFCDLAFPKEPSPFHDVRVRRATSYAINRKAIVENLLHGTSELWGDIYAPYQPGCNPDLKPHPYDPEKAKALLKEAGYPNGFEITFTYGFLEDKVEVQAMAADLARIGIRSRLVELEPGTYINNFREKKFHGLSRGSNPWWGGMLHPGVANESGFSSANWTTYFISPEAEAACMKLINLTDEKAIVAQAREVSRLWHELEHRYPLWAYHQAIGIGPRIKSYKPIPGRMQIGNLEFMELKD